MSSKRNHAARSRKTYRQRMYLAQRNLRGSLPFVLQQMMRAAMLGKAPLMTAEQLADKIDAAVPPEEEAVA